MGEKELDPIAHEPSEMICQVDFPQKFDLLDVLAVCWSVQRTRRCSAYTLQRYNCYFICMTILAILGRRVGEWEGIVESQATWSKLADDVIVYLRSSACEDADEYTGLATCEIINPDHPNPRDFILYSIHNLISVDSLKDWRKSTSTTLWTKHLEPAIKEGLAPHVQVAVTTSLNLGDTCAKQMKAVLDFDDEDDLKTPSIPHKLEREIIRCWCDYGFRALTENAKSVERLYVMHKLEYKPPLWCQMAAGVLAPILVIYVCAQGPKALMDDLRTEPTKVDKSLADSCRRNPVKFISPFRLVFLSLLDDNVPTDCNLDSFEPRASPIIQQVLHLPICAAQITKLQALMLIFDQDKWSKSLQSCVGRAISNATKALIATAESNSTSHTLRTTDTSGETTDISVEELHDWIRQRIRQHAKRVELVGLAAAELVEIDIDIAMSEVWSGLPEGHGRAICLVEQRTNRRRRHIGSMLILIYKNYDRKFSFLP